MELHSRHGNNNNVPKSESGSNEVKNVGKSDPVPASSQTTTVVFIGLLLDLLAFTLILPLFPALLDHYKKHDSDTGLYPYLVSHVHLGPQWLSWHMKYSKLKATLMRWKIILDLNFVLYWMINRKEFDWVVYCRTLLYKCISLSLLLRGIFLKKNK